MLADRLIWAGLTAVVMTTTGYFAMLLTRVDVTEIASLVRAAL